MTAQNSFLKFWSLGYKRLVPIIPHDAQISEKSSLFKRVGHPTQDARGKSPGVRGQAGKWYGFDWLPHEADEKDLHRWATMGAGVGIKTGEGLVAIDADTLDADSAIIIRDLVQEKLGRLPVRVGRAPKALYLCRVDGPYRYTRVEFGERNQRGELTDRVEILSDGRQFVAHGIHPKTKQPYEWPRGIVALNELPTFTPAELDGLMNALRDRLPAAAPIVREGASTEINQEALKGDLETITKAVAATPNTSDLFPTREAYRDYGYAIKAALPNHEHEAFDLFADWCARWTDGDNDPDIVAADWRRMKPPFRRGAGWLYELAEQHGAGKFNIAEAWFEDADVSEANANPFRQIELNAFKKEQTDIYRLLTIDEIINRPPPTWLIARYVPEKSVGFLYSEPGAGKSFLALDAGLSIAYGLPTWHGDDIRAGNDPVVIYIAAEGSYGFRNRIQAWMNRRGLSAADRAKSFLLIEQTVNFMNADDINRLLRTLRSVGPMRPVLVVVDTVSRALPGADENLQKDMTIFVKACDAVRDAFGCAVLGVHHAGKSGDMRGSTVLRGAGDFVFRLERKKGAVIGTLECEKQKDGPDGWSEPYRFDPVTLGDGETSLVVERSDVSAMPVAALTPDLSARVLSAMADAWDDGEPWSKSPQAATERRAVRRMVFDFGFDAAKAEELLEIWEQTGVIEVRTLSARHKLKGFYVRERPGQSVQSEGIFG